ncbi:signal peptidase I [Planomicrobium soli]|uniref:Signal peptidase I n=1 Tax=Planomicrobium soli TaxID=1176648 RepID=A0A2P8GQE4_9BACL|nr:S26 family signal peptidase [Planomicrobium soli]PSL36183.1 signal peptidase I [Planomicrobium soli]
MNRFKRDMDKFIGKSPRFNEPLKERIVLNIKEENKSKKSAGKGIGAFRYAAIFAILLAVATSFLILTLNENGQETQTPAASPEEKPVLTDRDTVAEIEILPDYEEPLEVFDFKADAMDRGNHEYSAYPLLIDPLAYKGQDIARGDVVVYEAEFFGGKQRTIGRVIGLSGEAIEIVEGQIYINDQQLDTFYGRAHRMGISSNEEYNRILKENGAVQNVDSMKEIFSRNTAKFRLADDEIFVAGDDWFRGSQHTLKITEVQGEVIGYYKE